MPKKFIFVVQKTKNMERIELHFSNFDSFESFGKAFNKEVNTDSWYLSLSASDCTTSLQKEVFRFIKERLIHSGPGFFYTGPDLACTLTTISEANFESQPQFFDTLINKLDEVSDMLTNKYNIKINAQIFGGRFGKYINFYIDLDELTFDELANFLDKNYYFDSNIFEDIYYYVTEQPEYFEKFSELIEWLAPGCGKYASDIIKCDLNYIDVFESELLKLVRKKDKATIKKNIKDIYYYASHY